MILETRVAIGIAYFAVGVIIGTIVYRYTIFAGDKEVLAYNLFLWPYFLAAMAIFAAGWQIYHRLNILIIKGREIFTQLRGRFS